MPDSVISIRDMVIAAIGASGFTPQLKAVSTYDPEADLQSLAGGRLVVTPQTLAPQLVSRSARKIKQVKVDLAVQYKCKTPSHAELDPYLSLAESFADYFLGYEFTTPIPGVEPVKLRDVGACMEVSFPHGLWFAQHMTSLKVFTSVITLAITYTN